MDVARTAIRHGSRDVTVYVRRDKVAASENEYNYAVLDGVHFEFRKNIVRIVDEGAVFCDRVEDPETGKLVDDHSTDQLVEADSVIISVSQVPRDRLVNRDHELQMNQRGTLQIDEQGETTMEGVFASGDVVTGAKTVVAAVAAAKQIADNMDVYCRKSTGTRAPSKNSVKEKSPSEQEPDSGTVQEGSFLQKGQVRPARSLPRFCDDL